MTVIQPPQQPCKCPKSANSATNSDTESLHLGSVSASDNESLYNEPLAALPTSFGRVRRGRATPPELLAKKIDELRRASCKGKKKQRRLQNRCDLQTLDEEDEEQIPVVIMESYKGPFTRLLEDAKALHCWNTFIEKSEEEQKKIIASLEKNHGRGNENHLPKSEKPFSRVSARIRRMIKIKKNLQMDKVKLTEEEMLDFFRNTPKEVYTKFLDCSFDRLMMHAIAQYHCLISMSIWKQEKRSVVVHNGLDDWAPASSYLYDFISHLHSQKS